MSLQPPFGEFPLDGASSSGASLEAPSSAQYYHSGDGSVGSAVDGDAEPSDDDDDPVGTSRSPSPALTVSNG